MRNCTNNQFILLKSSPSFLPSFSIHPSLSFSNLSHLSYSTFLRFLFPLPLLYSLHCLNLLPLYLIITFVLPTFTVFANSCLPRSPCSLPFTLSSLHVYPSSSLMLFCHALPFSVNKMHHPHIYISAIFCLNRAISLISKVRYAFSDQLAIMVLFSRSQKHHQRAFSCRPTAHVTHPE